jgi:hypothetical protein
MTPLQQQRFNTTMGGTLIGVGTVAWAIALFFAVVPNAEAPAPVNAAPIVELNSCRATLNQLGFQATNRGGADVVISQPMGENLQVQLEKASLAATVCKLPLHSFCMGEGCAAPGMEMVLRQPEAKRIGAGVTPLAPAQAATATPAQE